MAEYADDYSRLAELNAQLDVLLQERDDLELEWLDLAETLD
jgi:ABC transport system ATP-binding/permease protein